MDDDAAEVAAVEVFDHVEGSDGDALVEDLGRGREDAEHGPPAGAQVGDAGLDELTEALEDHVASVHVGVVDHGVLERAEEILLELEIGELLLLEEVRGHLSERVEGEEADLDVGVAADLGRQRNGQLGLRT